MHNSRKSIRVLPLWSYTMGSQLVSKRASYELIGVVSDRVPALLNFSSTLNFEPNNHYKTLFGDFAL